MICRGKAVKFTFANAHRALKYAPFTRAEQGRRASACGHRVRLQVHTAHLSVRKNEGKRRLFVIYTRDHEESSSSVFVRSDKTARAVISAWYNAPKRLAASAATARGHCGASGSKALVQLAHFLILIFSSDSTHYSAVLPPHCGCVGCGLWPVPIVTMACDPTYYTALLVDSHGV